MTHPKYMNHHHDHAEYEETLKKLLTQHAKKFRDRWYFDGNLGNGHTEEDALKIVDVCLYLDVTITDQVSVRTWVALVGRVAGLEREIKR